jgi:hypothetical protein
MKKLNLTKIVIAIVIIFFTLSFANTSFALKNLSDSTGILGDVAGNSGYRSEDTSLDAKIGSVIQVALSFVGVVFLVLMIYGGYLWMTARGEEQQITKAKDLIRAAIIGLIIIVMAYAISYFILKNVGAGMLSGTTPSTQ